MPARAGGCRRRRGRRTVRRRTGTTRIGGRRRTSPVHTLPHTPGRGEVRALVTAVPAGHWDADASDRAYVRPSCPNPASRGATWRATTRRCRGASSCSARPPPAPACSSRRSSTGGGSCGRSTIPGGTLDHADIPKFATPLLDPAGHAPRRHDQADGRQERRLLRDLREADLGSRSCRPACPRRRSGATGRSARASRAACSSTTPRR